LGIKSEKHSSIWLIYPDPGSPLPNLPARRPKSYSTQRPISRHRDQFLSAYKKDHNEPTSQYNPSSRTSTYSLATVQLKLAEYEIVFPTQHHVLLRQLPTRLPWTPKFIHKRLLYGLHHPPSQQHPTPIIFKLIVLIIRILFANVRSILIPCKFSPWKHILLRIRPVIASIAVNSTSSGGPLVRDRDCHKSP